MRRPLGVERQVDGGKWLVPDHERRVVVVVGRGRAEKLDRRRERERERNLECSIVTRRGFLSLVRLTLHAAGGCSPARCTRGKRDVSVLFESLSSPPVLPYTGFLFPPLSLSLSLAAFVGKNVKHGSEQQFKKLPTASGGRDTENSLTLMPIHFWRR